MLGVGGFFGAGGGGGSDGGGGHGEGGGGLFTQPPHLFSPSGLGRVESSSFLGFNPFIGDDTIARIKKTRIIRGVDIFSEC